MLSIPAILTDTVELDDVPHPSNIEPADLSSRIITSYCCESANHDAEPGAVVNIGVELDVPTLIPVFEALLMPVSVIDNKPVESIVSISYITADPRENDNLNLLSEACPNRYCP